MHKRLHPNTTLAMAPFAQKSLPYPHPVYNYMQQLPASAKEITGLPGLFVLHRQPGNQNAVLTTLRSIPGGAFGHPCHCRYRQQRHFVYCVLPCTATGAGCPVPRRIVWIEYGEHTADDHQRLRNRQRPVGEQRRGIEYYARVCLCRLRQYGKQFMEGR